MTKNPTKNSAPDERPQIDKFREAAREFEADDSEENFDKALKRVAKVAAERRTKGAAK